MSILQSTRRNQPDGFLSFILLLSEPPLVNPRDWLADNFCIGKVGVNECERGTRGTVL